MNGRRVLRSAVALLLLVSLGCDAPETEFARRFEVERARWRADALEARWLREAGGILTDQTRRRLAEVHAEIAREFGAAEPPSAASLANLETLRRLQIAGASALFCADLKADTPSLAWAQEYSLVATVYGFDPELRWRARLHEGWIHETRGDARRALAIYEDLLGPREGAPGRRFANPRRAGLEIHAAFLVAEVHGAREAKLFARSLRNDLERALASPEARRPALRRVLAEAFFLEEDWEAGLAILAELTEASSRSDVRAELLLTRGEVLEFGARDVERAEACYRDAILEGVTFAAGRAAKIRLGELLTRTERAEEGLVALNDLLGFEVLDSNAEALYAKARCLAKLGRMKESVNALSEAKAAPRGLPHTLAAAADLEQRRRPGRGTAAPELVALAAAVPARNLPHFVAWTWVSHSRAERHRALWRHVVEALEELAAGEPDALAAREQAARLARERLGA